MSGFGGVNTGSKSPLSESAAGNTLLGRVQVPAAASAPAVCMPERKRRIFDFEQQNTIIFEALALAEREIQGPPEKLAAAVG